MRRQSKSISKQIHLIRTKGATNRQPHYIVVNKIRLESVSVQSQT